MKKIPPSSPENTAISSGKYRGFPAEAARPRFSSPYPFFEALWRDSATSRPRRHANFTGKNRAYMNTKQIETRHHPFEIHAYGLQELALRYFPHSTPQGASNQLKRWMNLEPLRTLLGDAGYRPGQKILTPRQAATIVGHVGEP